MMKTLPYILLLAMLLPSPLAGAGMDDDALAEADQAPIVPGAAFGIATAVMPETIIFSYMRRMEADVSASQDLKDEISRYRVMALDRKRKLNGTWLGPDDFARRRQAFLQYLQQAEETALQTKPKTVSGRDTTEAELRTQAAAIQPKLALAARVWPDPLIRNFLIGLTGLQTKSNLPQAEAAFQNCCRAAPQIVGFRQALGLTLAQMDRPLDGLQELVHAARLSGNSRYVLELMPAIMEKVPGAQRDRQPYIDADQLIKSSSGRGSSLLAGKTSSSSKTLGVKATWIMPGKDWVSRDLANLPTPPYDRLMFRQALGVPVGKNTLLVEAAVLEGAMEVSVEIEKDVWVQAKARNLSSYSRDSVMPLALLTVPGVEFEPVQAEKETVFEIPLSAELFATNAYIEMGQEIRQVKINIKSMDSGGNFTIEDKLLPGEAAGAIITNDNKFVGFLVGKTDPAVQSGGADRFITLNEIFPLLAKAGKSPSNSSLLLTGKVPQAKNKAVEGNRFLVRVTSAELLK